MVTAPLEGMKTTAGFYDGIKLNVPSTSGSTGAAQKGYSGLKGRFTRS